MAVKTYPSQSATSVEAIPPLSESQKATVLRALEDILNSRVFRPSKRCKQFLSYIVERTLEGHGDLLKERTLGVEVFHRLPTYMTAEDSVVRVEAGEVRRRLGQYYATEAPSPEVRIEIPVGSYIPQFHWGQFETRPPATNKGAFPGTKGGFPATIVSYLLTIFVTALVTAGVFALRSHKPLHPASVVDQFWAPLFRTPQPVLICLAAPVVYRPSMDLYKEYERTHPGTYETLWERMAIPLPLDPNERIHWKDLVPSTHMTYVVKEDSMVAVQMLLMFDQIGKPSQVKSLTDLSIRDLRNSPAVLIGAFSNRWTMELTGNLPFYFSETGWTIREHASSGRVWGAHLNGDKKLTHDYAVVSRLQSSSTGQALIVAAGIGAEGTEAAGEFLSHPDYLSNVLRAAPPGWQRMNFQAVLQTDVTDAVAGPPQVVATRFW